jgi:hypothetical protein
LLLLLLLLLLCAVAGYDLLIAVAVNHMIVDQACCLHCMACSSERAALADPAESRAYETS